MNITDWITLAAVLVALVIGVSSIIQTQRLQTRELSERLLNEIIEWALEVGKPRYALNLVNLSSGLENPEKEMTYKLGQASNVHILIMQGYYIGKIAEGFTPKLIKAVDNLKNSLEVHDRLLSDWINYKCTEDIIGNHDFLVGELSKLVINECVEIKIKGIKTHILC
jgi:hypothetical protein